MKKSIRREKLSVWAGLYGILGRFVYDTNLTGDIYLRMLYESIIPSFELAYNANQPKIEE